MAIFKCKMCGGTIEFNEGDTIGVCDSCGTKQTLPKASDEAVSSLFNRANTLRLKSEFDRAEELYNKIISADETQAEAYWGIILCKYGIEYVEDPKTFKRVPTCHRTSFESITADEDFKLAVKHGDTEQKKLYEAEAKAIDAIQKDILRIAADEKPFDVFLCYKETDESGRRTQDSVIANDIYHQLTQEGYKVFYAAITLEDKLGQEYEPYIFAALNSAKVMLVIGSKPEYFTAVWVKNEWSRFLKLMKTDRSKLLIPCYKDMDAYELPDDFAHLQAQDMSKIGFINDVVRGIKKVVNTETEVNEQPAVVVSAGSANVEPLIKRAFMFLEDGDWTSANDYCEKVLDLDPEFAPAYVGKLMAEMKVRKQEQLADCEKTFDGNGNYQKSVRFGDAVLVEKLKKYNENIIQRNENLRKEKLYNNAVGAMQSANTEAAYKAASDYFKAIPGFKNADSLAEQCLENANICQKNAVYNSAVSKMYGGSLLTGNKITDINTAIKEFESIIDWKDSSEKIKDCQRIIEELKLKEESNKIEAEQEKALNDIFNKRREKHRIIGIVLLLIINFISVLAIGLLADNDSFVAALIDLFSALVVIPGVTIAINILVARKKLKKIPLGIIMVLVMTALNVISCTFWEKDYVETIFWGSLIWYGIIYVISFVITKIKCSKPNNKR